MRLVIVGQGMCIYRVHEPKPFVAMGCICTAFSSLLEGHDLGLSKLRRVNGIYQVSRKFFKCKGIIASEDSQGYCSCLWCSWRFVTCGTTGMEFNRDKLPAQKENTKQTI